MGKQYRERRGVTLLSTKFKNEKRLPCASRIGVPIKV